MRGIPVPAATTFVDCGAGKGRIVVCAAMYPFQKVTGVEIAPQLASVAREHVRRARRRFRCANVEILTQDATEFALPNNANVLHLFNPFRGEPLRKVISEVARSLRASPREVWILFGNPWAMDRIMRSGELVTTVWLKSQRDVLWPFYDHRDTNGNRYRIYRLDSRA
jgi:hypothetical protein